VLDVAPPRELPERDPQLAAAAGLQHELEPLGELRVVEPAFDVMPSQREPCCQAELL